MPSALIGHTGFVGGNFARQYPFDALFNSKNIEEIAGQSFDLLAISAMPAAMWIANRDPAVDRAVLDRLVGCLQTVQAKRVVVVSTVAVYPEPVGVDEATPIDSSRQTPYGRHRLILEEWAARHFPRSVAVRLPGLFGPGLKKNAIYDLLHDHETHKISGESSYQFYNLDRLAADAFQALEAGLDVVNFATAPVRVAEVAEAAFGTTFANDPGTPPALFDMRTRHAALFGGRNGYFSDKATVLNELKTFVARQRREPIA